MTESENFEKYNDDFEDIDGIEDVDELFGEKTDSKIRTDSKDLPIREFLTMKQEGELVLRPVYQRKFVMDVKLCSGLVESILMDVPIPVIYLAESKDGSFSVIDGQQRLTAFLSFVEGKFPNGKDFALTGLKVLKNLNKKKFIDLDKSQQAKIKQTALRTIVIKKESDQEIKFNVFERLNTGSIKLNEDELRNTIFRGDYVKLLAELEENATFHKLVRNERARLRMLYRGMILRFFALAEKSFYNYKPSMKQFCNKELSDNQNMKIEKYIEYRDKFLKTVELVLLVFGDKAFRRFMPGNNEDPKGKWNIGQLNMSLFDIQMCGFALYNKNQVIAKSDAIREALLKLMSSDERFINSIEISTSDKNQLQTRFKIWFDTLENIVGKSENELRAFSFEFKQSLYSQKPICALCKQRILDLDDSEVDHIVPYSEGGKTTIDNAQLTHRYCNRQKSNNIVKSISENLNTFSSELIYTEDEKLAVANEVIQYLYLELKEKLLNIHQFELKFTKYYVAFIFIKSNVVDIQIQTKALKLYLNIPKGLLVDKYKLTRDVSDIGHWGNGDYEIIMKSDNYLSETVELIKQTFDYHKNNKKQSVI